MLAVQNAQMTVAVGGVIDPHTALVLQDFMEGKQWEQLVNKVGETLTKLYDRQLATQEPEFKTQAKDAVDRACVASVAYVRVNLCRAGEQEELTQTATKSPEMERVKRAKQILDQLDKGLITMESAQITTLRSLVSSLGMDEGSLYSGALTERLVFDFPSPTSIIVDTRCRRLKGFIGARWIAEEYKFPLSYVNALFGTDIKVGGDLKTYQQLNQSGELTSMQSGADDLTPDDRADPLICLWEVFDLDTKTTFIVCEGWPDYVVQPKPHKGVNKSFWPIFALVFNSVETEPGSKASIYPPSDVQLGKAQQKEWNRSRNELRGQRVGNRPFYVVANNAISAEDLKKIATAEGNQVVSVNLPPNAKLNDVLMAYQPAPIDPLVYDTNSIKEDLLLATGAQEANLGPAQANVTATNSTIAEQSRTVVAASNADDLDDWLNSIAEYSGGLMLREFSQETVKMAVGRGAVWPQSEQSKEAFSNELLLQSVSASSGRPNKALNISNWSQLLPLLLQAGANPYALIEETVKVYDANIDVEKFFPVPGLDTSMPMQNESMQPMESEPASGQPTSDSAAVLRGAGQLMPSGVEPMQPGMRTAVAA